MCSNHLRHLKATGCQTRNGPTACAAGRPELAAARRVRRSFPRVLRLRTMVSSSHWGEARKATVHICAHVYVPWAAGAAAPVSPSPAPGLLLGARVPGD